MADTHPSDADEPNDSGLASAGSGQDLPVFKGVEPGAIAVPLREAPGPAPRKGLRGLLTVVTAYMKEFCGECLQYPIEWMREKRISNKHKLEQTALFEAQTKAEYEKGQRERDRHAMEMFEFFAKMNSTTEQARQDPQSEQKRRAAEEAQKQDADARAMLRELADAKLKEQLKALADEGIHITLRPDDTVQ